MAGYTAAGIRASSAWSAWRNASENVGNGWITSSMTVERDARADRDRRLLQPLAGLRAEA